jgi:hypothetical protein
MLRSLLGTVADNDFSLVVVAVVHDGSRMMSKDVATVIYSWLYTTYVYLCNIYQCNSITFIHQLMHLYVYYQSLKHFVHLIAPN